MYFLGQDDTHGYELWKSDGTDAGTVLVKDINPGANTSYPCDLTNINGTLYFLADDGTHGLELWKSDGTTAGTVMVKDIWPGSNSSMSRYISMSRFINVNGTLYFLADDGTHGSELWKSDGTTTGTVLVKDIRPGANASHPYAIIPLNGTLYFQAIDGTHGDELWKSDGTAVGTVMVKDIRPGIFGSWPRILTNVNGTLYFLADDGIHGQELWKSDGTTAGTVLVKDINPGANRSYPQQITNVNGILYFSAGNGTHGSELWKSDGTTAGTVMVKDINPGSNSSEPDYFTYVNGILYFSANNGTHGREFWKSDGTTAGTVMVKDINPGSSTNLSDLTNVNGVLYFQANDGIHGQELWKSNGTTAGTVMVKDILPGANGSLDFLYSSTNVNGTLYFLANDGIHGQELWKSNGTTAGTVLVKDINPGPASIDLDGWDDVNGTLYLSAYDGTHGYELWKVGQNQAITFAPLADQRNDAAPFTLTATAGSGLPVSFSVVSGPATLSGNTLTLTGGVGTVVVRAFQGGNLAYNPGSLERSFNVTISPNPALTDPVNGAVNVPVDIPLYCNGIPNATIYTFEANTDVNFNPATAIVRTSSYAAAWFYGLQYNTRYYVRVRTNLPATTWGVVKSFTTAQPANPVLVSPLNGAVNVPVDVPLSCYTLTNATNYIFEANPDVNFNPATAVIRSTTYGEVWFYGLQYNTTYYVRVKTNLPAPATWGVVKSFTTQRAPNGRMAVSEPTPVIEAIVFPNPFAEAVSVRIESSKDEPVQLTLTDMQGRIRYESGNHRTNQVNYLGHTLSNGVYLLHVRYQHQSKVFKLVKSR